MDYRRHVDRLFQLFIRCKSEVLQAFSVTEVCLTDEKWKEPPPPKLVTSQSNRFDPIQIITVPVVPSRITNFYQHPLCQCRHSPASEPGSSNFYLSKHAIPTKEKRGGPFGPRYLIDFGSFPQHSPNHKPRGATSVSHR